MAKNGVLQGTLDLLVLKTLDSRGPIHGYGIATHIQTVTDNVLRGGLGNDTLNGAAGTGDLVDFSDGAAGITFTLVNNGVGTVYNTGAANLGTDTYSGMEGVIGTAFADTLTGSSSGCRSPAKGRRARRPSPRASWRTRWPAAPGSPYTCRTSG